MKKRIEYLTDSVGNRLVGIKFRLYEIALYLKKFEDYCLENDLDYEKITSNQKERDDNTHHSTFLAVFEYEKVSNFADDLIGKEVSLDMMGIGLADNGSNQAYFIILHAPTLQAYRNKLGFENKDFHITIGFDRKDVFNKSKAIDSLIVK